MNVEELASYVGTHRIVPVTRTLFADAETPVGVYRKLAAGRPGTFLLESAEPGRSFSRWSFVGVRAVAQLREQGGAAAWTGDVPPGLPTTGAPLDVLGAAWRTMTGPRLPGLPPLTGGFVGYLAYDVVRHLERLPDKAVDDLGLPELTMLLVTDLAAVDHHECTVVLIANALLHPEMSEADVRRGARRCDPAPGRDAAGARRARAVDGRRAGRRRAQARPLAYRAGRLPARRRAVHRGHPRRRGVPDPARAAVRDRDQRRPVRRLPRAAHAQPVALPVPAAPGRVRHRRLQPGGAGHGPRPAGDHPPDRRDPQARRHAGAGRRAGRGARQRPEGTRRARHARRPRPQRPRPGVRGRAASPSSTSASSSGTATCGTSCRR